MSDESGEPEPEHIEFMRALSNGVQKLVGEDKMVAVAGDANNGVYVVIIGLHPLPTELVMAHAVKMSTAQLAEFMGASWNEMRLKALPTTGKVN